ncbi:MAG: hypothetical protein JEZ06_01255 [Anaerolineaceae bacterium]|nr:hypothetical protein [Anaerolineaceae bacterium]
MNLKCDIQKLWRLNFFVAGLEAIAALIFLFSIPVDSKNNMLFGYSFERLLLVGFLLLSSIFFVMISVSWNKNKRITSEIKKYISKRKQVILLLRILCLSFLVSWVLLWIPDYRYGNMLAYFQRLKPLIILVSVISFQSWILIIFQEFGISVSKLKSFISKGHAYSKAFKIVFISLLAIWLFIWITKLGVKPDAVYWNESGIPILNFQILFIALFGVMLLLVYKWLDNENWLEKIVKFRYLDILLFFFIWGVSAFFIVNTPIQPSYFSPGPYPPNFEFYPFSDSGVYDRSAQFAVIGQGLGNGYHIDKPLYVLYLLILHLLSGENVNLFLNLHGAILGIYPAILFLIGKSLHSRSAGIIVALLAIFKEVNGINAGSMITTSHSKFLLSEVPQGIAMLVLTYLLIIWLKKPEKNWKTLMLLGGVLGLTVLIRNNSWLLLPYVLLVIAWVKRKHFKQMIISSLIIVFFLFLTIAPWMWRSNQLINTPLFFMGGLKGVVWEGRYLPSLSSEEPQIKPTPNIIDADNEIIEPDEPPEIITVQVEQKSSVEKEVPKSIFGTISTMLKFISAHYFHNIVGIVMMLPTSMQFHDLLHLTKSAGSVWSRDWQGDLTLVKGLFVFLNLFIISVGITACWRRWKIVGLVPLGTLFVYVGALAVARTSGGRYLVPIDWGVYFYYGIGILEVITASLLLFGDKDWKRLEKEPQFKKRNDISVKGTLGLGALFLSVGLLLPLADVVIPQQYVKLSSSEIMQIFEERGLEIPEITGEKTIGEMIESNELDTMYGKALYPNFYGAGQGEPSSNPVYKYVGYPRLISRFISSEGENYLFFPIEQVPENFPHGSEVIIIGCKGKRDQLNIIDALMVVVMTDSGDFIYQRFPEPSLNCPFPAPN